MRWSRFAPRIRQAGFTLPELAVVMALFTAVGLTAFNVLRSGMLLSSQNLGINVSAMRGREMMDQVGERSRFAVEQPSLIDATGTLVSGSTADGVLIKNFVGAPYVLKDSKGSTDDVASSATQFVLEFRSDMPTPVVGDYMLVECASRPELEISAVSSLAASGTTQRRLVTTTSTIGEQVRPGFYRVGVTLYRKEAYVFVNTDATSNPRAELRRYRRVIGTTDFASATNFQVVATGFRRISSQAYFTESTSNSTTLTTLRAMVNSSSRQEVVARGSTVSTYTTVPVQVRLWALNH